MLEKVSQVAEQAATNVSRRGFLDRLGRGALVAAGALAVVAMGAERASAGRRCPPGYRNCVWNNLALLFSPPCGTRFC